MREFACDCVLQKQSALRHINGLSPIHAGFQTDYTAVPAWVEKPFETLPGRQAEVRVAFWVLIFSRMLSL